MDLSNHEMVSAVVQGIDPVSRGRLQAASAMLVDLESLIKQTIPLQPEESAYPDMFAEFVRYSLSNKPKHTVLVLPAGLQVSGDLELDWSTEWVERARIVGVVCEGDLTVEGDILNRNLDGGPLLWVTGNLQVNNLIKGGSPVLVLGDLVASGSVVGEYNHGVLRVYGDLTAQYWISLDHEGWVRGATKAIVLNSDEMDLTEVLVPELFEEDELSVDKLWAWQRAGLSILKPDAEIEFDD